MTKSHEHMLTTAQEFAVLERALNQTTDDAVRCLKILKKNLLDYDNHHGNHFMNTAMSYMRSEMRTAKDTAFGLKHLAHQVNKSPHPSQFDIDSARNVMNLVVKSMDVLSTKAGSYDQKNGRSKGVKGMIDNAIGKNDKEKHEKDGDLFGNGATSRHANHVGLFGTSDERTMNANHDSGLLGKMDGVHHHHGGGIFNNSDTLEQLVTTTLHDNFNVNALSHQITNAEKSLSSSPSLVARAKEVVHEVKDKLKGEKSPNPTHYGHPSNTYVVAP